MFDEMISKKLIEWIWVLASIGVVINGIVLLIVGRGGWSFLLALFFMAIGLLIVRVICESMIVIFKMHENLEQSAFALGEIQRYQPQIVSKLAAQMTTSVVSTPPIQFAGGTTAPVSLHDQKATVREDATDRAHSEPVVLKSRLKEWPGSSTSPSQQ